MALPFRAETVSKSVLKVRIPIRSTKNWEQWVLIQSDEHWDNPHCRLDLLKEHHEEAVRRKAMIVKNGDTFCAMQGKYDKRSDKSCLRPEHQRSDYLDGLVDTAAEWYAPYAANIITIGDGNHETSIRKRHETDLIERLCGVLHSKTGHRVHHGGYSGWIKFQFERNNQRMSKVLWRIHGYAGGGPVTRDLIQLNRQMVYVQGADILASGHTHDDWYTVVPVLRLLDSGRIEQRQIHAVKTATYKDEYGEGEGGWHIETGKPPKPLGARWVRFSWNNRRADIDIEVLRAGG